MRTLALIAGISLVLVPSSPAEANAPSATLVAVRPRTALAPQPSRNARLFDPDLRPAGSGPLLLDRGGVYRKTRFFHKARSYALALKASEHAEETLFPDRVALVRARAFESLGALAKARDAYHDAIERSQSLAVSEDAVRGMISVLGKQRDKKTELEYLDALIAHLGHDAESWLLLRRIEILATLDPSRARTEAWAIVDVWPSAPVAQKALKTLSALERRPDPSRAALAEVRAAFRSGNLARAGAVIRRLRAKARDRSLQLELDLANADLMRERGARTRAEVLLTRIDRSVGLGPARAKVLLHLAQLAGDRHQWERGRDRYEQLVDEYPESEEARIGAREWIQLEYDARNYAAAAERGSKLVEREGDEAPADALWLAAWSAHLAGDSPRAADLFERIEAGSPDSDVFDAATYWRGRTLERLGKNEDATLAYHRLVDRNPLGYYGLLAQHRLEQRGETVGLAVPPRTPVPATVEEAVMRLGASRPIGVDRAVSLFRANLVSEGVEELTSVLEHYRRKGDRVGVAYTIELFRLFDRDAWVFLLSRNIAERDGELLDETPELWGVWNHAYPKPFDKAVGRAARDHGVDPLLVYAVMRTESLFRPNAVSPVGARGLMQLMPRTARWLARITPAGRVHGKRFRTPESNVWLGARYVRSLLERYRGNVVFTLGAYNAGPATMDRWRRDYDGLEPDEFVERTPYLETRRYIRRALESYLVYRRLYGAGGPFGLVAELTPARKRD